ncbi:MAG: histidine kinase [Saprospiraceae bacterium]
MKSVLLSFFLCVISINISAQSPYIQQYTDRDGVPGMVVYQLLQGNNGLIWLTTDNGIAYFDGKKFTTVSHPKMKGQDFIGLYKAPTGRIWFWNWSGQVFYLNKNKIEYYSPDGFLDDKTISGLFSDKKGNITLLRKVAKESFLYCSESGKCEVKAILGVKDLPKLFEIIDGDETGKISFFWLNYLSGLNLKRGAESPIGIVDRGIVGRNKQLGTMYVQQSNSNILYGLDYINNKIEEKEILRIDKERDIRDIYCDKDENIWAFTNSDLFLFDKNKKPQPINIPLVEETLINSILQDDNGGYWMATRGEGLMHIPNINNITFSKENSILDSDNIISTITDTQKTIIVTAIGDIASIDNRTFSITKYPFKKSIQYIYKRPNGKGFFIYSNELTYQVNNNFEVEKEYIWSTVKSIFEENTYIYIGTSMGLFKLNEVNNNKYSRKLADEDGKNREHLVKELSFYSISNKRGEVYSGSLEGLFKDSERVNFSDNSIINTALVQDIRFDSINNILWLATNQGLHGLRDDKLVQSFNTENGLSNDNCNYLQFDKHNQIWVGTHQGVNIINTQKGIVSIIDLSTGLPSNRITSLSLNDTQAWVGTPRGVVYLQQEDALETKPLFPVSIMGIEINGNDTILLNSYTSDYQDNSCVISFVSPSFSNENLTYHYRLLGLNSNWRTTNSTNIPYTSLPSGSYQFEVYVTNDKGMKSLVNKDVKLVILKPFWQKWWFIIISLIISMGAVASISSLITRNYRRRKEEKMNFQRELSESKIKALQAQMNPHFIFNALNAIQFFFTTNSKELAMLHLNKFAKLIRLIFEYSKETTISLHQEIDFLNLYLELEKLRFDKKIDIEYTVDEKLEKEVAIPPLLIQPIIENAFKHGLLHKEGKGLLKVTFKQKTPSKILCIIEDDGVGRVAAKAYRKSWAIEEYRSSGVNTVIERIKLFNQNKNPIEIAMNIVDLEDENGLACGTRIVFVFDLRDSFFE